MTDTEFRRFVCDVVEINVPRKIHGLSTSVTFEISTALKRRNVAQRQRLRQLKGNIEATLHFHSILTASHLLASKTSFQELNVDC